VNGLDGLRRATAEDLSAVVALQRAAYARHVPAGGQPLALLADYSQILMECEVWLLESPDGIDGILVLEPRADDVLLWSVATAPRVRGSGIGNRLLHATDVRARELGRSRVRLYTGERLADNVAWYKRHGYVQERIESLGDRKVIHLVKNLDEI
jgi:N-acetylglutamate synthase-like GNAT family acetyltransferase